MMKTRVTTLTLTIVAALVASPALAGWEEGVAAFLEKRKPKWR